MSQNKTVIKGLEPESPSSGANTNVYGRSADSKGTVVPGMGNNPDVVTNATNVSGMRAQQARPASGKPVVGFLYSISKTAAGEFWPIHIGQNTIGQNPASDIVLPEGTVSTDHAVLVVRKMKNPEKVIASISDARSTNGTMLNGESLGFTAVECQNGDIITIGDNYELYLVLIDATALGLKVCQDFIPVQIEQEPQRGPVPPGFTRPGVEFSPYDGPTPPPFNGGSQGGTVGIDGSASPRHGGTVGMDDYNNGNPQW